MKTTRLKVGELILDMELYPRGEIDGTRIGHLRDALNAGESLDPITADKTSKKVSDGFHRTKLYLRDFGGDYKVDVFLKDYATEAELLTDAARLNARHGKPLNRHDKVRCLLLAEKLGVPADEMAAALSMTVDAAGELRTERVGKLKTNGREADVPLKRTFRHLAGKRLTKGQAEANRRSSGMNAVFYVNQVIDMLENDLLDPEDDRVIQRLTTLKELLAKRTLVAA